MIKNLKTQPTYTCTHTPLNKSDSTRAQSYLIHMNLVPYPAVDMIYTDKTEGAEETSL